MKVLHVYKQYMPDSVGGVEQVIYELAQGCTDRGITSDVFSLTGNKSSRSKVDGHFSIKIKENINLASTPLSFKALIEYKKIIKDYDLIHYHFPWPFMDLLHFSAGIKKPCIVTYHSDIVKQKDLLKLYRPLKTKFLSSVDKLIATSPNYLKSSRVLNKHRKKTEVIPLGVKDSFVEGYSDENDEAVREKFGQEFFLFVGVLRYYKGLKFLIDAMLSLPESKLLIAGKGPLEVELKEQVEKLGLKNIIFLGFVTTEMKMALLRNCKAFILPSSHRSEAFGVSLIEAAMMKKPMISTQLGTGTSFINLDNVTGLVVEPCQSASLSSAMKTIVNNEALCEEMADKARKRYEENFTSEIMVQGYIKAYEDLLTERRV